MTTNHRNNEVLSPPENNLKGKTNQVSKTSFWDDNHNRIKTSIGKWVGGEDVICHGHSMMKELLGHISYMQMTVLNVTGRLIDRKLADWLEGNFIGVSYPDSRIWCNQIGSLAASSRTSVVAATVAGVLAADSRAYGGSQTSKIGMTFIQNALINYKNGQSLRSIIEGCRFNNDKPVITGYARPVSRTDERLAPHIAMTRKLGFKTGEHLQLAFEIDQYLEEQYGLGMNVAGYSCSFLSDQGFSPDEMYQIKSLMVASGVTACFVDNQSQCADSFLPQHCTDIEYNGPQLRTID